MNYNITLNFTPDEVEKLRLGVCTASVGARLIKAEIDEGSTFLDEGRVLYETNNSDTALRLVEYAFTIADGGSLRIDSTTKTGEVFPLLRFFPTTTKP